MRRHRAWLFYVLALAGCSDEPVARSTAPIAGVSERADASTDRAVVAITRRSGPLVCTGTLIAPRVVVTAAHCAVGPKNYFDHQIFIGADVSASGARIELVDARPHPQFDAATFANDIAVLFLRDEAPMAPRVIRTTPVTELGVDVRVVGYGRTKPALDDAGIRRQGTAKLSEISPKELTLAGGAAQPCAFDSGGPSFISSGGVEQLIGVTSRGDSDCAMYARITRIDAHLEFINGYLAETREGTRALGEPCLYDRHCISGVCFAALDEARIRYCSAPCTSSAECGALVCAGNACQKPRPTPGAPGASCTRDDECIDAECLERDGKRLCARACSPVNKACPNELVCTQTDTIRFACLPAPAAPERESGCAMARRGQPGVWLALILAVLLRRSRQAAL